jgi:cation diffusion facilitator family transporter
MRVSILPPDSNHMFGHGKAEYFSSIVEGFLILAASAGIAWAAIDRFIHPRQIDKLGSGLIVSFTAMVINFTVARILFHAGNKYDSITLEADSHHLMTDVWTSAGVIVGVALSGVTGWLWIDPLVALSVALNIVRTAYSIIRRSVEGLMDVSLPQKDRDRIDSVLDEYRKLGIGFHAILTRQAAYRRFVSIHVLVPGRMSVHDAHHIAEDIERDIRNAMKHTVVFTHIEPLEDEISLDDIRLDR